MRKYNRALDYAALAIAHVRAGKHEVAAKLLMQAASQDDTTDALKILEASNKAAYAHMTAATKVTAMDEFSMEVASEAEDTDEDEPTEEEQEAAEVDAELESDDPLDEIEDEDLEIDSSEDEEFEAEEVEAPSVAMARVLASMTRRSAKRS